MRLAVAAAIGGVLVMPVLASAAEEEKKEQVLEEVTVTGSRIVRKDLDSNSPTVTVESEAFNNRANLSVESVLNELPQFAGSLGFGGTFGDTFRNSQQGATANQFTPGGIANSALDPLNTYNANNTVGATSVSLRGLGSNRTLLLMNGRRLVPVNASLAVDTSSIPSSALQRVEVVTGGASSVYGADAVSGVVNFILKDNYEGAELDVQYGLTEVGDNQNLRLSGLLGGSFADGRGNAFIGLEYSKRGAAWSADRGYNKERYRNPLIAAGGNLYFTQYEPGTTAVQGTPVANPSMAAMDLIYRSHNPAHVNGTVPVTSAIVVNPNGTIFVPSDPEGALGAQLNDGYEYKINDLSGTWGYNNLNARLSSPSTRYSLFSSAHFDFTDDLRFYTQATFAHNHSEFISTPGLGQFTSYITLNRQYQVGGQTFQNPIPTELAQLLNSRLSPPAGPNPAVSRANDPYAVSFPLAALFPEAGSKSDALNFQFINGFSGNLPIKDWTFDVFNSYGKSRSVTAGINAVSIQALRKLAGMPNYGAMAGGDANGDGKSDGFFNDPTLGTDLVDAPSNPVYPHAYLKCTSGLGPALYPSLYPGQTVSADCLDSLTGNPVGVTEMMQDQVEGAIQGGLFELPAGDLRFALGGGWRTHRYDFDPSDMISTTNIFDVQANTHPTNPAHARDSVTEGFAELLVPVLRDVPFVTHLNLELGYRYSDYKYAGPVSTWKALADWAITPGLRLRGGFQRANRAPNLVELFDPGSSAVQIAPGDPCSASYTNNAFGLAAAAWGANPRFNPENAAKVRALCQYQMGATGASSYYTRDQNNAAFGGNLFNFWLVGVNAVGNPNLKNEKSDTWTAGIVLRSPFEHPLARFTATFDWFKIKVDDAIFIPLLTTLSGSPLQSCWDARINPALAALKGDGTDSAEALAAADAPLACRMIQRSPDTGGIITNRDTPYNNVGSMVSEGVDFGFNWSASLADLGLKLPGRISYGANANYMLTDKRQSIAGAPYEDFTGVANRGGVRWSMTNTFGYFNGAFNASLNWRHYPSLTSLGRFQNTDQRAEGIDPYDVLDLSFGYSLNSNLSMRAGVQNLLGVDPPISGRNPGNPAVLNARGYPTGYSEGTIATGVYDALGRSYFMGFKLSF